jgi:exonuclease III
MQTTRTEKRGLVGTILRVCIFMMMVASTTAIPKENSRTLGRMTHGLVNDRTRLNETGKSHMKKVKGHYFPNPDEKQDQSALFGDYVGDINRDDIEETDPDLEFSEEYDVEAHNIHKNTGWFDESTHHWIGNQDPLQNDTGVGKSLGQVRAVLINNGGHVRPFDDHGKPIYDNRLAEMCRIVTNKIADIIIGVEGHLNEKGASMCRSYVKSFTDCEIECAVPSALAAKMTVSDTPEDAGIISKEDEDDDKGRKKRKHVGPAGIVIVMSPQMKARMRGRPEVKATGRLIHIIFGDGATAKEDRHPLHIIAVYGVSAVQQKDAHRVAMADDLKRSLTKILLSLQHQRVLVCGDINSVAETTDRASGKLTSYDTQSWASPLWKVLKEAGLIDVMARVCVGQPPMTYCHAGSPTSRIDVMYASPDLVNHCGMRAATGARAGTLSKTHRPLAISFSTLGFRATKDSGPVTKVAVFKTCVRTARWQPSEKTIAFYNKLAFTENKSIVKEIADMDEKYRTSVSYGLQYDVTAEAKAKREIENMTMYFCRYNQIICAAAELSIQPRQNVEAENIPDKMMDNMEHILIRCSQLLEMPGGKSEVNINETKAKEIMDEIETLLCTLDAVCEIERPKVRNLRRHQESVTTAKTSRQTWAVQIKLFIKNILVSKGIASTDWSISRHPNNTGALKMSTNEMFGAMANKGGGGPFDGFVYKDTFESNLDKLTEVVKVTQQDLNVNFWSTEIMRTTLTVGSSHDFVVAKTPKEADRAAKSKILELEQLKTALTLEDQIINVRLLRQQLKISGYPLAISLEDDIQKAALDHESSWKLPSMIVSEIRTMARSGGDDRNRPELGSNVKAACKATKLDWKALRGALKEDDNTLAEVSPRAANELETWMSEFEVWRPSSPSIQASTIGGR